MNRCLWPLVALGVFTACFAIGICSGAAQTPKTPTASGESSSIAISEYTLPPDKLEKARALYDIQVWLNLASTFYSFALLFLFLRFGWVARFRDWAEQASRSRFLQAGFVIPLSLAAFSILMLPPDLYGHYTSLKYGLSVQAWPSWFRDWALEFLLTAGIGTLVGWILYLLLRRSPSRAWLYFWLAVIPIAAFLTFITPAVIDPMFNKFEPLESTQPQLVSALEQVIQRAGLAIPPARMYEMKASEKLTGSNAYVTGFGATKRVVVWDTAIQKLSLQEIEFIFGHELGHYVLGHIVKGFLFAMGFCLLLFYLTFRLAGWVLRNWGADLSIRGLDDWASLPLLGLIAAIVMFLSSPGLNGFSRYLEHQADVYGLEVVHGLVPNSSEVAAASFQHLGEEWLDYPYASRAAIICLWDHPSIPDRIQFALSYDPWKQGRTPQFVTAPAAIHSSP
jgi:STE24 endopeptidase